MTIEEAEEWAAAFGLLPPVYHVTTTGAAVGIQRSGFDLGKRAGGRAWGDGVYAAIDAATRDHYLQQLGRHGVASSLRVNVRRFLAIRISSRSRLSPQFQALGLIPGGIGRYIEIGMILRDPAASMTRVFVEAGYDAVEIRETQMTLLVGGNQLVVFDPRRVVVIDDEVRTDGRDHRLRHT